MGTTYIQFETPKNENQTQAGKLLRRVLKKSVVKILAAVIPKANPDFENKIDAVKYWLVEFEAETGIPQREIGLDDWGKVILKMPYKDNTGYWTDNNLLLSDFKNLFHVQEIDKTSFETRWELFL